MNTIIVTGASGLVGRFVISDLLDNTDFKVVAVSSCPDVVQQRHTGNKRLISMGYDDFLAINEVFGQKNFLGENNYLLHCAFTRKNDAVEVKRSIDLAKSVFNRSIELSMDGVLNISSRSVYREPNEGCLNTEESELYLPGLIAMGKYTVELLTEVMLGKVGIHYSNLRLASVNELKTDNNMVRPLNVFVENTIVGNPIRVVGGMQVMSYIAPQDVASAIRSLLLVSPKTWRTCYNVGTGWMCTDTLLNMAKLVVERGAQYGLKPVDINVEPKEVNQHAGLDISKITADTGWKPNVSLTDMVDGLYKMKIEKKQQI